MSQQEEKKYVSYSLCFYQKDQELRAIAHRARLGFDQFGAGKDTALKTKTIENFRNFNRRNKSGQKELLQQDPESYIDALLDIVICLNRQSDLMEYVLTTLDAIFTEQRHVLRIVVDDIKNGKYSNLISKLKGIETVNSKKDYTPVIVLAANRLISTIMGELPRDQFFKQQQAYIIELLNKRSHKDLISDYGLVSCFVHLNKHEYLAHEFMQYGGGSYLLECLNRSGNDIQLIYYAILNIWMLSFVQDNIEKWFGSAKFGVIKQICDILQKVSRQKITRVAFMIFKNLQDSHPCLQLMIDNRLLKIIDTILKGNIKDQELIGQIKDIGSVLESNVRVLSSFDKYVKQVNSELLEWSSVHNQRFWKQNALRFEANQYHIIKKLKHLLHSKRSTNVAVACYDIGEFCRFYPRGRDVIESLSIKDIIMEKARYSEDKSVKEQALMALQKVMIQNWQAI